MLEGYNKIAWINFSLIGVHSTPHNDKARTDFFKNFANLFEKETEISQWQMYSDNNSNME